MGYSLIQRLENDASIWGDSSFCALLRTFRTIIIILLQPNIIPVWVPDSPSSITPIHSWKRSFEIWNRQEKGSKLSKNAYKLFSLATLKLFSATFFWKLRLFFQWDFPCGLSLKANYFYRLPNSQKKWSKRRISALNEFTKHFHRLGYRFKKMYITMSKIHL